MLAVTKEYTHQLFIFTLHEYLVVQNAISFHHLSSSTVMQKVFIVIQVLMQLRLQSSADS